MSSVPGRAARSLLISLAAAAILLVGCGDDSSSEEAGGSSDLTVTGAEDTVRLYIGAVAAGNGKTACRLLADDYEKTLLEGPQARQLGADTCPDYFAELEQRHAQAGESFTFEGHPIREWNDAKALEFETGVKRVLGEDSGTSATVRGEAGRIAFRLEAPSGRWEIAEIIEGG